MPGEATDVLLDEIDPRRRDVQRCVVGKAEGEIFLALSVLGDGLHAGEFCDAMRDVNDVVADFQIQERIDGARRDHFAYAAALFVTVEKLMVAEKGERTRILPSLPPGEGWGEGALLLRLLFVKRRPLTPALSRRERGTTSRVIDESAMQIPVGDLD